MVEHERTERDHTHQFAVLLHRRPAHAHPVEQAGDLVMDFVLDGLDTKRTRRTSREERAAEAGSCGVPKVISLLGERTIGKWVKDDTPSESGNVIAFPSRFHR